MNKQKTSYLVILASFIFFVSFLGTSCTSYKNIKYFKDIPDSGQMRTIAKAEYNEPTIQVDDIITVLVETVDPRASAVINQGNIPITSSVNNQQAPAGYLVNKEGFIDMPVIGKIKALGLTTSQLRGAVELEAVKYFKDLTIIVRFANFKVSVTGEVSKPGQYIIPNEKVSILDAIAMAGDLTIYGKRDNVLLIRENIDGSKTPYRVNLNKSNIMSTPFYFLRQNDLIYVEPSKGKAAANDLSQTRLIAITSSVLSLLVVLATRIK